MGLFLVRWSDLRVSLIEAPNETSLLHTIDTVDNPAFCTWQKYTGPVWIDFRFPADVEISDGRRDHLRADEIRPILRRASYSGKLSIHVDDADDSVEMMAEIMNAGFPQIAAAFARGESGTRKRIQQEDLEGAVVNEVLHHDRRIATRGTTIDDLGEGQWVLRRSLMKHFRRTSRTFIEVSSQQLQEFCFGERSMRPGYGGKVRVAEVEIAYSKKTPLFARVSSSRAFTTSPNGIIVRPHQADAFGDMIHGRGPEGPFKARRDAAVQWKLSADDISELERAVRRSTGRPIELRVPPDQQ